MWDVVRRYIEDCGWAVIPLHTAEEGKCSCGNLGCRSPGKHPRTKNGLKDATKDLAIAEQWWEQWPQANVGIVTGSISGIFVLDIDDPEEADKFLSGKPRPLTATARTSKGIHYYYKIPPGVTIPTKVRAFPGIDIRGEGGYVVAPPSIHASGQAYEWVIAPWEEPPNDPPQWLLEALTTGETPKAVPEVRDPTGRIDPTKVLAGVPEGMRNDTLFRYACRLRSLGLAYPEAEKLVLQAAAACIPPLPEDEARRCVKSAWRYEVNEARALAALPLEKIFDGTTERALRHHEVKLRGRTAQIVFPDLGISVWCRRIHWGSKGQLTADVEINANGVKIPLSGVINLATPTTRAKYGQLLSSYIPSPYWGDVLEGVYLALRDKLITGSPPKAIALSKERRQPFVIAGFLPAEMDTVLWGAGGTGKSWLALAIARALWQQKEFLGMPVLQPGKTIYIDYETNEDEFARRLKLILTEQEIQDYERDPWLWYVKEDFPLLDRLDTLQEHVLQVEPALIIVDSLSRALGGGLFDLATIAAFFQGIRSLNCTVLIIHHSTKDEETFYGSAYVKWEVRSMWQISSRLDPTTGLIQGILTHEKANIGKYQPPIGFELSIEPWQLRRIRVDAVTTHERPISQQIVDLLLQRGKLTVQEIADYLEVRTDTVRRTLNRLKTKGRVAKDPGGCWYVPADEEPIPF